MLDISVVIPTRNSSRTIAECLESVKNQTSPCREIIVIDRFSDDATVAIARQMGVRVIESRANRSLARNIGINHATSSAVLFVDSDMVLSPTLIEECENGLKKHHALVIPELSVGDGFWAKCKILERQAYLNDDTIEAARCFRKSVLLSLGGHNPRLEAGEDWDLHNRARKSGVSVGRVQAIIFHDEGHLTLRTILEKKYRYGKAIGEYLKISPAIGFRQVNPLGRLAAISPKMLSMDPAHGAGVIMMKTLEYTVAGIGLLKHKVSNAGSSPMTHSHS